jgi:hypothetical protein
MHVHIVKTHAPIRFVTHVNEKLINTPTKNNVILALTTLRVKYVVTTTKTLLGLYAAMLFMMQPIISNPILAVNKVYCEKLVGL